MGRTLSNTMINLGIKNICLHLHESAVDSHPAIDLEHLHATKIYAGISRILAHGVAHLTRLKAHSFKRSAHHVRSVCISCEANNNSTSIISPVRGVEAREGGHKVDSSVVIWVRH